MTEQEEQKQIEEMAMLVAECNGQTCDNCRLKCRHRIICEILHDNGYGDTKQAVREFAEKQIKILKDAYNNYIILAETASQRDDLIMCNQWSGQANATQKSIDLINELLDEV